MLEKHCTRSCEAIYWDEVSTSSKLVSPKVVTPRWRFTKGHVRSCVS